MANPPVVAMATLEVFRVIGQPGRWRVGGNNTARALEKPERRARIVADPLAVDLIGVLADSEVVRPLHPGQVHVDLHLRVMLGPRPLHAMFLELLETLRIRRLELEDVPLARLAEAAPGPVERPAEVAPVRAHPELLPGRFVDFVHLHADRSQVGNEARLLPPPG